MKTSMPTAPAYLDVGNTVAVALNSFCQILQVFDAVFVPTGGETSAYYWRSESAGMTKPVFPKSIKM